MYNIMVTVCTAIRACLAAFWYPMKERCYSCCDDCDKKITNVKIQLLMKNFDKFVIKTLTLNNNIIIYLYLI